MGVLYSSDMGNLLSILTLIYLPTKHNLIWKRKDRQLIEAPPPFSFIEINTNLSYDFIKKENYSNPFSAPNHKRAFLLCNMLLSKVNMNTIFHLQSCKVRSDLLKIFNNVYDKRIICLQIDDLWERCKLLSKYLKCIFYSTKNLLVSNTATNNLDPSFKN